MNYNKIYNSIIDNRLKNPYGGYVERHHILPRSLGGSESKNNIVELSAREHFLCHYLLAKMFEEDTIPWYKMNHAFMMMKTQSISHNNQRYFNSKLYDYLRRNFSCVMSKSQMGKNNSQYGTIWISNIDTRENKKISKRESIPEGWVKGRNQWSITDAEIRKNERQKKKKEEKYKRALVYWNEFHEGNYYSLNEYAKCVNITQQSLYRIFKENFPDIFVSSKKRFTSNKGFIVQ